MDAQSGYQPLLRVIHRAVLGLVNWMYSEVIDGAVVRVDTADVVRKVLIQDGLDRRTLAVGDVKVSNAAP